VFVALLPAAASARTWSLTDVSPATSSLDDVWCTSAEECVGVGSTGDDAGTRRSQTSHWSSSTWAWTPQEAPEPSGSSASELSGVSCASATDCVAVGNHLDEGTKKTLAMTWDGSSWSLVSTPNPSGASSSELTEVACASSTMCLAVGSYVDSSITKSFAARWDGTSWSLSSTPSPSGATSSELSGVSCVSTTDCTAAGSYVDALGVRKTLVLRSLLTIWSVEPTPDPSGASSSELSDVRCASSVPCTAIGSYVESDTVKTLALRRGSSTWAVQSTPNPSGASSSQLAGIACPSSTACTAVGSSVDGTDELPLALDWDGSSWSERTIDAPAGASAAELAAISCATATDCSTVGSIAYGEFTPRNLGFGLDEGDEWYVTESGGLGGVLRGVACTSATKCVAVGQFGQWSGSALDVGWTLDATDWSVAPTPELSLPSLNSVSCSAAEECTAVGSQDDQSETLAERWDGEDWTVQSMPSQPDASQVRLHSVSCPSSTSCIAVGQEPNGSGKLVPLAEAWDGSSWTVQTAPRPGTDSTARLNDVSCVSASSCVAVGAFTEGSSHGFVERWNGTSWSVESIPEPSGAFYSTLTGVSCSSSSACTAVGHYATSSNGVRLSLVVRWNGSAWSVQSSPNPSGATLTELRDVSCPSATACVAVGVSAVSGEHGVALGWDGTSWSVEPTIVPSGASSSQLDSVSCTAAEDCVAVGASWAGVWEPLATTTQAVPGEEEGTSGSEADSVSDPETAPDETGDPDPTLSLDQETQVRDIVEESSEFEAVVGTADYELEIGPWTETIETDTELVGAIVEVTLTARESWAERNWPTIDYDLGESGYTAGAYSETSMRATADDVKELQVSLDGDFDVNVNFIDGDVVQIAPIDDGPAEVTPDPSASYLDPDPDVGGY
jgi:hypothetical protein